MNFISLLILQYFYNTSYQHFFISNLFRLLNYSISSLQIPHFSFFLFYSQFSHFMQIQDIFSNQLIQNMVNTINNSQIRLKPVDSYLKTNYGQKNTKIQQLFQLPFDQRNPKIVKKLKHQIKDFYCFNNFDSQPIENQSNMPVFKVENKTLSLLTKKKQISQQKNKKPEIEEIFKRDMEILIKIFSMYSSISSYSKGQIIDVAGSQRQKIRILIKGDIAICQPLNNISLKNCVRKFKSKASHQTQFLKQYNDFVKKLSQRNNQLSANSCVMDQIFEEKQQYEDLDEQGYQAGVNKLNKSLIAKILNSAQLKKLSSDQANALLAASQISSPLSPYLLTQIIQSQGRLLSSIKSKSILNQDQTSLNLQDFCNFTSMCLSNECQLLELDYVVYKKTINHINKNQQKQYISSLMSKFQCLTYQDALDYIKKKSSMINFSKVQKLQSKNQFDDNTATSESSSLYHQIPFDGDNYLIVQGQVTVMININSQYEVLDPNYARLRRVSTKHQILKLYTDDIFGIQAIGQQKLFGLKYYVKRNSKILKMESDIVRIHEVSVPKFRDELNFIKSRRDTIIANILKKLQTRLQKNMVKRYWNNYQIKQRVKYKELVVDSQQNIDKNLIRNDESLQFQKIVKSVSLDNKNTYSTLNSDSIRQNQSKNFYLDNSETTRFDKINIPFQNKDTRQRKSASLATMYSSLKEKFRLRQVQFIGNKQFPQIKKSILNTLQKKQKKQQGFQTQRLTVELIKELDLVDFKQKIVKTSDDVQKKVPYLQMRNPNNGTLIRKKSLPSYQQVISDRNYKTIQKIIRRKIGIMTENQKVKHNLIVVKNRNSPIKYQNFDQKQRKQQKRLKSLSKNVPKLQNFFSKKADVLYNNHSTQPKKITI